MSKLPQDERTILTIKYADLLRGARTPLWQNSIFALVAVDMLVIGVLIQHSNYESAYTLCRTVSLVATICSIGLVAAWLFHMQAIRVARERYERSLDDFLEHREDAIRTRHYERLYELVHTAQPILWGAVATLAINFIGSASGDVLEKSHAELLDDLRVSIEDPDQPPGARPGVVRMVRFMRRGALSRLAEHGLSGVRLRQADLRGVDLRGVDLSGSDLTDANLTEANLARANLAGADVSGVTFPIELTFDQLRTAVWDERRAPQVPGDARQWLLANESNFDSVRRDGKLYRVWKDGARVIRPN